MRTLEEIIADYTDEDLEESFNEIVEWRNTGVLKIGGKVRFAIFVFKNETGIDFPAYAIDNPFLFEMAKRYYR
jgi:hypothetical protein